jgi:glycosyltransferase involved in cell wall biosynthesis
MRVGLDGIPLNSTMTGVGYYTSELVRSLAAIAPTHEFEVLSPFNGFNRRLWWLFTLPRYCRELALFHGTNYQLPYWTTCPTVLTIHDLSLLLYPQTHQKNLVSRARLKLPFFARKAGAIITPSETIKSEVCEHLGVSGEKVFAIPYAGRSAFYAVPRAESDPVRERLGVPDEFILFVGTVEPRKNLLNLVRAFDEIIRHTSLRTHLVIAGKQGWLSDELMGYLNNSQIKERVLFTGHVEDAEVRALYSSCRVFVYPSIYEGFGLPLLEAMMCGVPVVTSNVPSIVETVGDVARLASPTDFRDLAQAIKTLLEDPNERQHRAAAGLEHAKKFSWTKTAEKTLGVYEKVNSA